MSSVSEKNWIVDFNASSSSINSNNKLILQDEEENFQNKENSSIINKEIKILKFLPIEDRMERVDLGYDEQQSKNKLLFEKQIEQSSNLLKSLNRNEKNKSKIVKKQNSKQNVSEIENRENSRNRHLTKREKIDESDTEDSDYENENKISWIILPDDSYKRLWDIYIAFLLIYSAIVTPYRTAFIDNAESEFNDFFDYYIDFSFLIDLILNFFSAYVDSEDNIIVKRRNIIMEYIKSWFFIDLLSIIPISYIMNPDDPFSQGKVSTTLGKMARIPKLYRLIKLTKLFRMVKIVKKGNMNKITRYFLEKLKVSANIERLLYFAMGFLILNHFSACIWYFMAKLQDLSPDCWVIRLGFVDYAPMDIYMVAFYWNLTTVTTVGYGDVSAGTTPERIYSLFIMSFGVLMYSFAIGSLSTIVSNLDSKNSEMNQKLQTLSAIRKEFKLDQEIFNKVRKVIKYDLSRNPQDRINFLQELPTKLRIELSQIIQDNIIKKMHVFANASPDIIAFVTPLMKPIKCSKNEVLYKIGDSMDESKFFLKNLLVYFVYKGTISLTLNDKYRNKEIKQVKKNSNFGEVEMCLNEKLSHNIVVMSRNAELFLLKKNDFLKLSFSYKEFVEKFIQRSIIHYMKLNDEKKKAIQEYESEHNIFSVKDGEKNLERISELDEEGNNSGVDNDNSDNFYILENFDHLDSKNNLSQIHEHENDSSQEEIKKEQEQVADSADAVNVTKTEKSHEENFNIAKINQFVEKLKMETYKKFTNKIEKILKVLEDNNVLFNEIQENPIDLLLKLKSVKEINDRSEILDKLESIQL